MTYSSSSSHSEENNGASALNHAMAARRASLTPASSAEGLILQHSAKLSSEASRVAISRMKRGPFFGPKTRTKATIPTRTITSSALGGGSVVACLVLGITHTRELIVPQGRRSHGQADASRRTYDFRHLKPNGRHSTSRRITRVFNATAPPGKAA